MKSNIDYLLYILAITLILIISSLFSTNSNIEDIIPSKINIQIFDTKNNIFNKYTVFRENLSGTRKIYHNEDKKVFFKKIILKINENKINSISKVIIHIKDKIFTYILDDLFKTWVISKNSNGDMFFESPSSLHSGSFLRRINNPYFQSIINLPNLTQLLWLLFLYNFGIILLFLILLFNKFILTSQQINKNKLFVYEFDSNKKYIFSGFVIIIITFIPFFIISRHGIDVHHQGFMYYVAHNMFEGKLLFKDIYYHYGILTAFFHTWSLYIFGDSLFSLQIVSVIAYSFISVILWVIMIRIVPKYIAFISILLWILIAPFYKELLLPWSSIFSLLFQLLTLLTIIKFLENRRIIYCFFSGIFVSLAFWCRFPVGMFLFFSILIFILIELCLNNLTFKNSMSFIFNMVSGILFSSIPIFYWLFHNELISDWWLQNFAGISFWVFGSEHNTGYLMIFLKILKFPLCLMPTNLWIIFPLCMFFVSFDILSLLKNKYIKHTNIKINIIILLILVCIGSWFQYYPVASEHHFYWASTPMLILVAFFSYNQVCLNQIGNIFKNKINFFLAFFSFLVFIPTIFNNLQQGMSKISYFNTIIEVPNNLSGLKIHKSQEKSIRDLYTSIHTHNPNRKPLISLAPFNILISNLEN